MIDDSDILRRSFIAIATDEYAAKGTFRPLDVAREVKVLRDWLTDDALGERKFDADEYAALAHRPTQQAVMEALTTRRPFTDADAVVLYVTGHGMTGWDGGHLIVLHDTNPQFETNAIPTAKLVGSLAAHPTLRHVLVIVDVCQAGKVSDNLPAVRVSDLPPEWFVVLTAPSDADAKVGGFSGAVEAVMDNLCTSADAVQRAEPYLRWSDFLDAVTQNMVDAGRKPPELLKRPWRPTVCLPNPAYTPGPLELVATDRARRDLAVLPEDMAAHWGVRAPATDGTASGPAFTGRELLMTRLIEAATGSAGTLVVSGRAGCGKSAALARLVTCSDPQFRKAYGDRLGVAPPVPPEGAVDVAVLATGKTSEQIAQQIARALGIAAPPPSASGIAVDAWTDAVLARLANGTPLTLVVDALDEATDPVAVLRTVLARLNPREHPRIRLLIGVRSTGGANGIPQPGERSRDLAAVARDLLGAEQVQVDSDQLWRGTDLRAYVARLLEQTGSPYDPVHIPAVAAAVEARAGRSYLVAGLAARALVASPEALTPDDPRLEALLGQRSGRLVAQDLRAALPDEDDRARAATLLRVAALAAGRGVPLRRIWPLLATAIDPQRDYGDSDIAWLLEQRLSGYLVRDMEDGLTVYRPFHEELRRVLADGGALSDAGSDAVVPEVEAHRRITRALEPLAAWSV